MEYLCLSREEGIVKQVRHECCMFLKKYKSHQIQIREHNIVILAALHWKMGQNWRVKQVKMKTANYKKMYYDSNTWQTERAVVVMASIAQQTSG